MMTEYDTVLLAEDDENDVLLFQTAFKKAGVPKLLVCVPDGEDAIKYLKGAGIYSNRIQYPLPCLLITDLKMAKRTGFDLLDWVQTQTQLNGLPAIVLSSSVEEPDKRHASELGAQAYRVKPAHFEDLVDLVCLLKEKWLTPPQPADLSSIQNRPQFGNYSDATAHACSRNASYGEADSSAVLGVISSLKDIKNLGLKI